VVREGVVTFKYWVTPELELKVCIKPLKANETTFCSASFVRPSGFNTISSMRQSVRIPPQFEPFQIMFWTDSYTLSPGAICFLDDINYWDKDLCHQAPPKNTEILSVVDKPPNNIEEAPLPRVETPEKLFDSPLIGDDVVFYDESNKSS